MSDEKEKEEKVVEVNVDVIDINSVEKINVDDGDALIVTMPEQTNNMPNTMREKYVKSIQESFENIFQDKVVRVIIIPHGMKVELALSSKLEDKEDDKSSEVK